MPNEETDRRRSTILPLLLCLASLAVGCQGTSWALERQAELEFHEGWSSIPRGFRGDDIAALTRALAEEKGEYETGTVYAERVLAAARQKTMYAFCVDPAFHGQRSFGVTYDAEKEQFEIKVTIGWDSSMLLAQEETARNAYLAQNAIGTGPRTVDVTIENYSLRLMNDSLHIVTSTDKVIYEGATKYPLAEAPNFKDRIKMLVVTRLVPGAGGTEGTGATARPGNPYYEREYSLSEATAARPVNINEYSHFLCARIEAIWVYDGLTGIVIGKHHLAPEDDAIVQARQALADGKYFTAQALISKVPGANPVVKQIRRDIEAMRLENADEESRRLLEGIMNERLRNHGPEPDPAVVKKFIQKLVPTLVALPCEIISISPAVKSLPTVNGELRAAWQVRTEVKNKKELTTKHLYIYIKYDEIIGFDLL